MVDSTECGAPLPNKIHGVSVSLPRLADLIGYERRDEEALRAVQRGYPRFHLHPLVRRLQQHIAAEYGRRSDPLPLLTRSRRGAAALCAYAGIDWAAVASWRDIFVVWLPDAASVAASARKLLQHTGAGISSRHAERLLLDEGLLAELSTEERADHDAEAQVKEHLARAYGAGDLDQVFLATFGMNAIAGVHSALSRLRAPRLGWAHFGWIFMDTMEIVRELTPRGRSHSLYSPLDCAQLESLLRTHGRDIAGIFLEAPSNPLMRTPDLAAVRAMAHAHGCAVIVDATLGTPHNVDVLPFADVVVESLTKYACGSADVMMGAVVLNPASEIAQELRPSLASELDPPHPADMARMAHCISGYAERMSVVNRNTMALAELLGSHRAVQRVHWAYAPESRALYERIQRGPERPGGILTLDLAVPLEHVYDRLRLPKGPSLGAEFTLVGPYLYHAHYDLVSTEAGRAHLHACGLNPDLLRVSVGVEPVDELLGAFSEALDV